MNPSKIPQMQKRLLAWYHQSARDLPWRRTKDPYKIWVSEIMLQQTQVDTVTPYYQKWLKKFPTLKFLAQSPLSEVMKHWAGLGYYRRARMLHEAAKTILKEYGGKIPRNFQELIKLPGIGKYTAGAISSIAFGQKTPILDGNVIRILTRIFALKQEISQPATIRKLWTISESLVPGENPGDFNQAMMELGATVCAPDSPRCGHCPVSSLCRAHQLGTETGFPVTRAGEKLRKIRNVALVLRAKNGKFLLQKQPEKGRWGGLWMFPFWKDKKTMLRNMRLTSREIRRLITIKHGFTKYLVTLEVYEKKAISTARMALPHSCWLKLSQRPQYALPAPHQKIVSALSKRTTRL